MAHPRRELETARIAGELEKVKSVDQVIFWERVKKTCHDCADGEAPRGSKPWTCARVARKEVACNMADQWRPRVSYPHKNEKIRETMNYSKR